MGIREVYAGQTPEEKVAITRDEAALQSWLGEWVYDLDGRASYVEKLGSERVESLRPGSAPSGSVDYGSYR